MHLLLRCACCPLRTASTLLALDRLGEFLDVVLPALDPLLDAGGRCYRHRVGLHQEGLAGQTLDGGLGGGSTD